MREIKFRTWDGKKISYDYIMFNNSTGKLEVPSKEFKIMQFTGLKDINGKEIYEGDIIKRSAIFEKLDEIFILIGFIEWCDKDARFHVVFPKEEFISEIRSCDEVISNIHENPELKGDTNEKM